MIQLLHRLEDRFEQVILITHIESVREGLDQVIRVEYDERTGASVVREEFIAAGARGTRVLRAGGPARASRSAAATISATPAAWPGPIVSPSSATPISVATTGSMVASMAAVAAGRRRSAAM